MLQTARLELRPATLETLRAARAGRAALAAELAARVPPTWPHEFLDDAALQFMESRLLKAPQDAEWWMHFVLLKEPDGGRTLVGSGGYKGPPSPDGTVEIGYGLVSDFRGRGLATEAARALVRRAFDFPEVRRVIAETLPALPSSIAVLRRCGFLRVEEPASEPEVIRFEVHRSTPKAEL